MASAVSKLRDRTSKAGSPVSVKEFNHLTQCAIPFFVCTTLLPPALFAEGESGRLDSNQRPLRPERSTLANLSYAPLRGYPSRISRTNQAFSPDPGVKKLVLTLSGWAVRVLAE